MVLVYPYYNKADLFLFVQAKIDAETCATGLRQQVVKSRPVEGFGKRQRVFTGKGRMNELIFLLPVKSRHSNCFFEADGMVHLNVFRCKKGVEGVVGVKNKKPYLTQFLTAQPAVILSPNG